MLHLLNIALAELVMDCPCTNKYTQAIGRFQLKLYIRPLILVLVRDLALIFYKRKRGMLPGFILYIGAC